MCAVANPEIRLFISYASVDRADVLAKVQALNERRISAWVDLDAITAGASYGPEITDGIRNANAVLLMCSKASLASRNVRQEIQLAWKYDRPIIPVLLEQLAIPDDLAYWLEGAQWIDSTALNVDAWIDRVLDALIKRGIAPAPSDNDRSGLANVAESAPGNIPQADFPLIGRDRELKRLIAMVSNSRLVTVTGPGGVGKTTLSVETARRLAHTFSGGAWVVDESSTSSSVELIAELAQTLGVQTSAGGSLLTDLAEFVGEDRYLIVLDNLEQNPAAGAAIGELMEAVSGLTVIVTSRTPLRIPGEANFPLAGFESVSNAQSLSASEIADSPGVALFVGRARNARPEFVLTDGNAAAIAEICARLDGLPLAIELAAARSRLMPPAAILERLGSALDLGHRNAGSRSDRQQTLRSTINWSYELLNEDEQATFRELAVCEGGFSLEATQGICSNQIAADHLESLLDHHLVANHGFGGLSDSPRFRMLETVRSFAHESLVAAGELDSVLDKHLAWYLAEVRRTGPLLEVGADPSALDALTDDHANIRRAFDYALNRNSGEAAAELTVGLIEYWLARGQLREGIEFATRCISNDQAFSDRDSARLFQIRAILLETSGNLHDAGADWQQAVKLAEDASDSDLLAKALGGLGTTCQAGGDYDQAATSYERALKLYRVLENIRGEAATLHYLGSLETLRGNYPVAREHCTQAIRLWRNLGELQRLAYSIQQDGILAFLSGEYDLAIERYEETLALVETVGDQYGIGNCLINLGSAQEMVGRLDEATTTLNRARSIFVEMGDIGGVGYVDYLLGHIGRLTGDPLATAKLNDARKSLSDAGDSASLALVHETLAGLAVDRRDKSEAEEHFAQADRLRVETSAAVPGSRIEEVRRDRERLAEL